MNHDLEPRDYFPILVTLGLVGLACIVAAGFIAWMGGAA
jgi:hypothetical protein